MWYVSDVVPTDFICTRFLYYRAGVDRRDILRHRISFLLGVIITYFRSHRFGSQDALVLDDRACFPSNSGPAFWSIMPPRVDCFHSLLPTVRSRSTGLNCSSSSFISPPAVGGRGRPAASRGRPLPEAPPCCTSRRGLTRHKAPAEQNPDAHSGHWAPRLA